MVVYVDIIEVKNEKTRRLELSDLTVEGLFDCIKQSEDLIDKIKDEHRARIDRGEL